jgi:hypothetical protein
VLNNFAKLIFYDFPFRSYKHFNIFNKKSNFCLALPCLNTPRKKIRQLFHSFSAVAQSKAEVDEKAKAKVGGGEREGGGGGGGEG